LAAARKEPKVNPVVSPSRSGETSARTGVPQPILSIAGFSLWFQSKEVLSGISLDIPRGQFVAIIGPSGSGKSTLLNAIAGFVVPTSNGATMEGEILVGGSPPTAHALRCGVVFQEYALFPWRTAQRNVEFSLEALEVPAAERASRSLQCLQQVGLGAAADLYPHQLSGGMKQRVAIARALAYDPSVLLMDEPLGALDALTREKLMSLIEQVWQQTRTTVVYITHNVGEAVFLADRVLVLKTNPGEVVFDLTIDLPRPRDPLGPETIELERRLREAIPDVDEGGE
jgi:NitT/TauT family transport system ATP-binding protein